MDRGYLGLLYTFARVTFQESCFEDVNLSSSQSPSLGKACPSAMHKRMCPGMITSGRLRTALLTHEAVNKFGKTVRVEIGEPLPWDSLSHLESRQELTDFLYGKVQELGQVS